MSANALPAAAPPPAAPMSSAVKGRKRIASAKGLGIQGTRGGPAASQVVDPHAAAARVGEGGHAHRPAQPAPAKRAGKKDKPSHLDKLCGTEKRDLPEGARQEESEVAAMVLQRIRDSLWLSLDYEVGKGFGLFSTLKALVRKKGFGTDKTAVDALGVETVDELVSEFVHHAGVLPLSPKLLAAVSHMTHS